MHKEIPPALTRAQSLVLWCEVIAMCPDAAHRRADWWRNTMHVVWVLMRYADSDMITKPWSGATWDRLAQEAGVSRSTLADRIRWLRIHGFLFVLMSGSTPQLRGRRRRGAGDRLGNLAAQYALTVPVAVLEAMDPEELERLVPPVPEVVPERWEDVPWPVETLPVDVTRTPRVSPYVGERSMSPVHARASDQDHAPRKDHKPAPASSAPATPEPAWSGTVTPVTKSQRLQACRRLREDDPVLRKLPEKHLRHLLRPLFQAGATVNDVKYAFNLQPDGRPWPYTDDPRWMPGWVRWRVAAWADDDGTLRAPLPSQVRAEANRVRLLEQAQRAERTARERENRGAPDPEVMAQLRVRLCEAASGARRSRTAVG
ncbi:hypothetical protein Psi01_85140 [Planobispora siamensis]|uniref:Helix-turn-helix domain-containing protein n=2 Tax=Planobispora siamensis TaxID=936338 RepID=A0A8J3ST39_9ACTN|nr:hypothetical protein Psi01_85140 [Planobispora siamensis]